MGRIRGREQQSVHEHRQVLTEVAPWEREGFAARPDALAVGIRKKRAATAVTLTTAGASARFRADELAALCAGTQAVIETVAEESPSMFLARVGQAAESSIASEAMERLPEGSAALLPAEADMTPLAVLDRATLEDLEAWIAALPGPG